MHALKLTTNRALLWTPWAHRAECACGEWTSGPLWLTKKAAQKAYREHSGNALA